MSIKRSGVALALAAALALGAGACGSSSDDNATTSATSASGGGGNSAPTIALLLPENKTARYENQDRPRFEQKVRELCPDCRVIYANAEQDAAKQQQQAEQALTNGADVLVIDAVDVRAAAAIANRAKDQDVPVVSYARLIDGADVDAYVSIDPFRVGQQQGRALLDALRGESTPSIVMINGSPTDSNSAPYKAGAHDVLDRAGVRIVKEYDTPDWSPDRAQTEMEQAITAAGKDGFDAVYSANDGMAGGAIAAMKSAGIDPRSRPTTGQDAEVAGLQRILTGDQLMTVYQPINEIAATAAELAVPLGRGERLPPITTTTVDNNSSQRVPAVLLDTIVITRDNIEDPVIRDGFATAAQICTDAYQDACRAAGIH